MQQKRRNENLEQRLGLTNKQTKKILKSKENSLTNKQTNKLKKLKAKEFEEKFTKFIIRLTRDWRKAELNKQTNKIDENMIGCAVIGWEKPKNNCAVQRNLAKEA